jgi:uncharacterized protein DUF6510
MDSDQTKAPGERADDERASEPARLDGNVAAGILTEVFVPDLTTARATCANCGVARRWERYSCTPTEWAW